MKLRGSSCAVCNATLNPGTLSEGKLLMLFFEAIGWRVPVKLRGSSCAVSDAKMNLGTFPRASCACSFCLHSRQGPCHQNNEYKSQQERLRTATKLQRYYPQQQGTRVTRYPEDLSLRISDSRKRVKSDVFYQHDQERLRNADLLHKRAEA